MPDEEFIKKVRAGMKKALQEAEAWAAELGLPLDAKWSLMRYMARHKRGDVTETEEKMAVEEQEFTGWAEQHVQEREAEAAAVTEELGLPPDAMYTILRLLGEERRSNVRSDHSDSGEGTP